MTGSTYPRREKAANDQDSGETKEQISQCCSTQSAGPDVKTQERPGVEQKSGNGQEPTVKNRAPTKPGSSAGHPSEPQYLGTELVVESRKALGKAKRQPCRGDRLPERPSRRSP